MRSHDAYYRVRGFGKKLFSGWVMRRLSSSRNVVIPLCDALCMKPAEGLCTPWTSVRPGVMSGSERFNPSLVFSIVSPLGTWRTAITAQQSWPNISIPRPDAFGPRTPPEHPERQKARPARAPTSARRKSSIPEPWLPESRLGRPEMGSIPTPAPRFISRVLWGGNPCRCEARRHVGACLRP